MPAWGTPCPTIPGSSLLNSPFTQLPVSINTSGIASVLDSTPSYAVMDVEAPMPMDTESLLTILTAVRSAGAAQVGFYAIPLGDYWDATLNKGRLALKSWQAFSDGCQPIIDLTDFVCPSLYTYYSDMAGWMQYALANINEAKRIANGKPVYPFIMPEYHPSAPNGLANTYVGDSYWTLQLNTIRALADGVVIWGGFGHVWDPTNTWQPIAMQFN